MDNVCHTLAGAALSRAGFDTSTRLATATLMIASNLPDVDVLVFATDIPSVAFRRGWTHGVVAQALLPLALAAVMFAVASRGRHAHGPPARFAALALLSYLGVVLHVFMDYLNNYGVRLLMPLSGQWFYGDAAFIVDIWLWLMLGAAFWLGRRGRTRPARMLVAGAAVYIVLMLVSARAARTIVAEAWTRVHGRPPQAWMVGPVPVTPLRKQVIIDAGDRYYTGTFTWFPRGIRFDERTVPKNDTLSEVAVARQDRDVAGLLVWSRFPFWEVEKRNGEVHVTVGDMRFAGFARGGFSETVILRP